MEQIARTATQESWGYLNGCQYTLHDRDKKFCASFRSALAAAGVKPIMLPAKSPNLNAYAERWVRSVKQECLSKLVLLGEGPLQRSLSEYTAHYHLERNHQGKDNKLLTPLAVSKSRKIHCHQRLGGLLKFYAAPHEYFGLTRKLRSRRTRLERRQPSARTVWNVADKLQTLMDRADIPKPRILVAHSYGALVAIAYALRHLSVL